MLDRFQRLDAKRGTRDVAQLSRLPMLVELLPRAVDGVLLGVEQMLNEKNEFDLLTLINAISRSILRRTEKSELPLPVAQHVRLEASELTYLADGEELLDRICGATHASCSARSSRAISSCAASLAGW